MNFNNPVWLYAGFAAVAVLTALFFWAEALRRKLLAHFASERLLPELSRTVSQPKTLIKKILLAAGVFAVFAALARPQWGYRWEETKTRGIDIVFAIDTSKSMLAEDVKPNRLERAKLAVLDLVDVLEGDKIGLVAFAGQSFLQCPLTLDYDAFRMSLEALDTSVIQRGGTNIAAAISEAEVAFASTDNKKIIVLISDGEELESSAVEKAKQAAKNGVVVYTLGVGATRGEEIPVRDERGKLTVLRDEKGNVVKSRLDEKILTSVAEVTGGFYEPLGTSGIDAIYKDGLKKIPQQELNARMRQLAIERFQIPLGIGILLLALESLIGTRKFFVRRRGLMRALALAALLSGIHAQDCRLMAQTTPIVSQPAQISPAAQDAAPDKDKVSAKTTEPEKTTAAPKPPLPRDIFNAAVAEYEKGDYEMSKDIFTEAMRRAPEDFSLQAKALYNMGCADYKLSEKILEKAEIPQSLEKRTQQVLQGSEASIGMSAQLLKQGAPLLKQEREAVAAAKTPEAKKEAEKKSPLRDKQFQEQLKQGISQCEAIEKEEPALKKDIESNTSVFNESMKSLKSAAELYTGALSLDKKFENAKRNLAAVSKAEKNLASQIKNSEDALKALASNADKIKQVARLKEELKKLVRDDENKNQQNQNQNQQNKQNQQNQQNKDNKQNQQQQNQQNQQQNQQQYKDNKQNQDNKDKQQNQQQNQDKQQNQQDKNKKDRQDKQQQDQNQQQNKKEQDKQQNSQNQKDQKNQNKEQNKEENKPQQKDQKQDAGKDSQKRDEPQQKEKKDSGAENKPEKQQADERKNEQAAPSEKKEEKSAEQKRAEQGQENKKEAEKREAAAPSQAEKQKKEETAKAAAAGEKKGEEQGMENFRKAEGAMTRHEAKQLLESMKDSEKILPVSGFGEQKNRYEDKTYKDW